MYLLRENHLDLITPDLDNPSYDSFKGYAEDLEMVPLDIS